MWKSLNIDVALRMPKSALRLSALSSYALHWKLSYITYFMTNLCFWVCFRSKNLCDVWGLEWNECLRVLSYSFGKWLCDMLNFLFLFTETHVLRGSCYTSDRIIFHAWLKLLYWSDKLSGITQQEEIYSNIRRIFYLVERLNYSQARSSKMSMSNVMLSAPMNWKTKKLEGSFAKVGGAAEGEYRCPNMSTRLPQCLSAKHRAKCNIHRLS